VQENDIRNGKRIIELVAEERYEEALCIKYDSTLQEINKVHLILLHKFGDYQDVKIALTNAKSILREETGAKKGMRLSKIGKKEEALPYLKEAVKRRGEGQDYHWYGCTLVQVGRYGEALPILKEAVKRRGEAQDYHWYGCTLVQVGRYGEALPILKEAVKRRGEGVDYEWLRTCQDHVRKEVEGIFNKGLQLSKIGKKEEALPYLEEAVKRRGEGQDYHWYGCTLVQVGRYDEALPILEEAVKRRGEGVDYEWLRKCQDHVRRKEVEGIFNKGLQLSETGKKEEALPILEEAVKRRGEGQDYHWYGRTLVQVGRYDEALPILEEAVKRRGEGTDYEWLRTCQDHVRWKEVEGIFNKGLQLSETGKKEEALPYLEEAMKRRGEGQDYHWYGRTLVQVGRYDEALPILEEAVKRRGEGQDYHWYASTLFQVGRYDEALPYLENAARLGEAVNYNWIRICQGAKTFDRDEQKPSIFSKLRKLFFRG
jgi:tetratricopeptide (TPR) repeat protein